MTRRYGEVPRNGQRYTFRRGVYAILERNGQLLITHQVDPEPEFQLPGGGIDPGEPPIVALHREVLEETGWKMADPLRLGAFRRFTYMPEYDLWAEKMCVVYLARPTLQVSPPTEPGHTAHWVDPYDAVQSLGNPGDRAMLVNLLRRR